MKSLTSVLVSFLALYHVVNFFGKDHFIPKKQWEKVNVEAGIEEGVSRRLVGFPWISSWPKAPVYVDKTSQFLRDIGYVARYFLGQIPFFVLIGRAGDTRQMFERIEIYTLGYTSDQEIEESVIEIRQQISDWQRKGAQVIFLPIPSKLSLNRNAMPKSLPPFTVWEPCKMWKAEAPELVYRSLVTELPGSIDLFSRFQRLLALGQTPYLNDDSHWNSLGIAEAARMVLSEIRPRRSWNTSVYGGSLEGFHFLEEYLQLPEWFMRRLKFNGGKEELFGITPQINEGGRVLVLGTSFCYRLSHMELSLGELLKHALGRDLLQFCSAGNGVWGSVEEFESSGVEITRGDIIVWESPVVYILNKRIKKPTKTRYDKIVLSKLP